MTVTFRRSFTRDLRNIKDRRVAAKVQQAIENVESADTLGDIANLKKLANTSNFYRIRIGDYRIGVAIEGNVVEFVRCLHRRDLYRYFP
ncbi:MAG: type II toxin-antitoxin system RelE/ParE family toxin [Planctomycetes bacterium]|nr:type II toxin-antitoxin system RelE/ParE family toxin [Planctomycetota bacterium]